MNCRPRKRLLHWFEPKLVVFGMTVANFVLLWYTAHRMRGVACVVCPWFYPWTYFNEPTLLLVAAAAILVHRVWSYVVGLGLSGYLVGDLVYRFVIYDLSIVENLKPLFSPYQESVYAWQIQYLLAFVVFVESAIYSVNAIFFAQNRIQQALGADSP